MEYLEIQGGNKLSGEVLIPGAKNAALPMMCGALLTEEKCIFHDVPNIADVERLLDIFKAIGVKVERDMANRTVEICAKNLDPSKLKNLRDIKKFRASILILGPVLSRFGKCEIPIPGGCILGARSLDIHISGLRTLGAEVNEEPERIVAKYHRKRFKNQRVLLSEASVTGTENLLLFLAGKSERSEIFFAAAEPHVCSLVSMLQQMGANIEGIETHHLKISGYDRLRGGVFTIPSDGLLVGTYAIAGILAGKDLLIRNVNHKELFSFYGALQRTGAKFEMQNYELRVWGTKNLQAIPKIQTAIYPGFSTDLQSPFGVLLTQCEGESMIFETLYEGRFTYLNELENMGAKIEMLNPHQTRIYGKTPLKGCEVKSWDLRAGAAMVLAGLIAEGKTTVTDINYLDRGYEDFAENLNKLGAKIRRATKDITRAHTKPFNKRFGVTKADTIKATT